MSRTFSILSILFFTISLNAQEWCNNGKPAKLDRLPLSFDHKLVSDRLNHTINPAILNIRASQIEIASIFSPEYYQNRHWSRVDSMMHIYSIYTSYVIKHAFRNNLEFQLSYTDLILKADGEITEYGKESLNTGVSVGAKYYIYRRENKKAKIGIFGQVTIPKYQNITATFFSPELRVLYSCPFGKHLIFTGNLGGIYINDMEKAIFLYDIHIVRPIGDRLELFSEFYRNYTKTGPARNPSKRYLFGLGFYLLDDLYFYSTIESGWAHEDTINDFRIDTGITLRIKG